MFKKGSFQDRNEGKGEVFDMILLAHLWDEFMNPNKLPPVQQVVRDMLDIYISKLSNKRISGLVG